ncbi:hypothetical protein [uncultured Ruegeria sp.]|uniref:NYN domain-containing protein n=1 Tax=uncultured Ruegeria sp. TaxID=259304 RepID=UPI00262B8585|nr:hypothetical protein [uncultured Ruegeria sp.]
MRIPFLLLLVSLCGLVAAYLFPTELDWLFLLALLCVLTSTILLIRAWFGWRKANTWIIVDGSNVMHWKDGKPELGTLQHVLASLKQAGFKPGVVFDANVGYKLEGHFMSDRVLSRALGLRAKRVMVAPKGTPADPLILQAARDSKARIVTNDRFRDWVDEFPDVLNADRLVKGGFRKDQLWFSL